jgi:hypothetical protein
MIYMDRIGHLVSDKGPEELHRFAKSIGLKRAWFQDKEGRPHYDLTTDGMKKRAQKAGAIVVNPKTIVKILKRSEVNGKGED